MRELRVVPCQLARSQGAQRAVPRDSGRGIRAREQGSLDVARLELAVSVRELEQQGGRQTWIARRSPTQGRHASIEKLAQRHATDTDLRDERSLEVSNGFGTTR